jgi:hypothetical protein
MKVLREVLKKYPVYLSRLLKEMFTCRKRNYNFFIFLFVLHAINFACPIRNSRLAMTCGLSYVTDNLFFGLKLQRCSMLQETSERANALQTTGGRATSMLHFYTGMCNLNIRS